MWSTTISSVDHGRMISFVGIVFTSNQLQTIATKTIADSAKKHTFVSKNFNAGAYSPLVVFLICSITCRRKLVNLSTNTIEKVEACGFCLAIIDHGSVEPIDIAIERSESCIKKLALHLQ